MTFSQHIGQFPLEYTAIVMYDHNLRRVMYHSIYGHLFGLKSSLVNFNDLPHALCSITNKIFTAASTHFVHNYITVDIVCPMCEQDFTAQQCLDILHTQVSLNLKLK